MSNYVSLEMMLEDGISPVVCMGRGNSKYDGRYRLLHVVSYDGDKCKCADGYTWNHAYPVDVFGNLLTLEVYNLMKRVKL